MRPFLISLICHENTKIPYIYMLAPLCSPRTQIKFYSTNNIVQYLSSRLCNLNKLSLLMTCQEYKYEALVYVKISCKIFLYLSDHLLKSKIDTIHTCILSVLQHPGVDRKFGGC
jgi:hypothetical protein